MRLILTLLLAAAAAPGACVEVSSERIFVGDLLEAVPPLRALAPDTLIGFAPLPGTERIVSGRELMLLAGRQGIILSDIPDVCIERALHVISREEMHEAMLAALGMPVAQLEILEISNQRLPPGRLEFQRSMLTEPPLKAPETPVIWKGKLIYDGRHSAVVWAKVRILVDCTVLVAVEDIPAGTVLRGADVKATAVREFPFAGTVPDSLADIVGKVARKSMRAGQRLTANAFDEVQDVVRGDIVQVRVIDGPATLSFDGIAASSGKKGDTILVHNSASGRNFRAVVEDKGKAVVRPASGD